MPTGSCKRALCVDFTAYGACVCMNVGPMTWAEGHC